MNRRQVLGWLSGVGLLTVGASSRTVESYLKAIAPAPADGVRERALKLVRFLNTTLAAHRAKTGGYADLKGLQSSPVLALYGNYPYAVSLRAGRFSELAPHYQVAVSIKRNGQGYKIVAREDEDGFEYLSDETGVIRWMTGEDAKAGASPRPILEAAARRRTGPAALVVAIAGFFVPVLSANEADCNGSSCLYCSGSCSEGCCNWGTLSCTWCVKRWASCVCPG